jgi:hypothetical protein
VFHRVEVGESSHAVLPNNGVRNRRTPKVMPNHHDRLAEVFATSCENRLIALAIGKIGPQLSYQSRREKLDCYLTIVSQLRGASQRGRMGVEIEVAGGQQPSSSKPQASRGQEQIQHCSFRAIQPLNGFLTGSRCPDEIREFLLREFPSSAANVTGFPDFLYPLLSKIIG